MSDMTFVDAWRSNHPKHAADAKAMWARTGLLPGDLADERAKQLVGLVYVDGRLAAATTAKINFVKQLNARFAMLRGAVAPDSRRQRVCYQMAAHAVRVLEDWSQKNPDEKVVGVYAVMQSQELLWRLREPTWPEYDLNLNLVAYTPRGEQIRVAWFKHATLDAPSKA